MQRNLIKRYENSDILARTIYINDIEVVLLFMIGVSDSDVFNRYYLEKSINAIKNKLDLTKEIPGVVKKISEDEIDFELYSANIILSFENEIYSYALAKSNSRAVGDPISESLNIFGSRDGFVEDIRVNISLVRTRIKTDELMLSELEIGKRSKTKVFLLGIENIVNLKRYERIKKILENIEIDSILNITCITSYFTKSRIFPIEKYSGSPEEVAKNLLEGEIVIMIDRIPVSIILPTSLFFSTKIKIDDQTPSFYAWFQRIYVILSLFISVFWLGIFSSLVMYQSDNLSFLLLSSLKVSQRGVIFPVFYEIIAILFLFELVQLIGIRSPSATIQNIVVIVGGILIGQNTITSGLVGVVVMTLTAFSFIASFTITNDTRIIMSISLLRIIIFISSLFLGMFGVVLMSILLLSYIYKNQFLGISFLHPFIPFNYKDFKRFFINRYSIRLKKRNDVLKPKNKEFRENEKN